MIPRFKVKDITQTCCECPSQWEGTTICGKHIYIRYRYGYFRATVADTESDAVMGIGYNIECERSNNIWDGYMTTEQMCERSKELLDFSEAVYLDDDVKTYVIECPGLGSENKPLLED